MCGPFDQLTSRCLQCMEGLGGGRRRAPYLGGERVGQVSEINNIYRAVCN